MSRSVFSILLIVFAVFTMAPASAAETNPGIIEPGFEIPNWSARAAKLEADLARLVVHLKSAKSDAEARQGAELLRELPRERSRRFHAGPPRALDSNKKTA